MTFFLSIIILSAIIFTSAFFAGKSHRLSPGFHNFIVIGSVFIITGFALGPLGINLIPTELAKSLEILVFLSIGWIGLIQGLQFNLKDLKTINKSYYAYAILEYVTSFFVFYALLHYFFRERFDGFTLVALTIFGVTVSPSPLFLFFKRGKKIDETAQFLKFIAVFNNIISIVGFGILLISFYQITSEADMFKFVVYLFVVGLLGVFFILIGGQNLDNIERFTVISGMILFSSAIAFILKSSVVFTTFLIGVVISNFSRKRKELFYVLLKYEKPVYIFMLIITGAFLRFESGFFYVLMLMILFFVISRFAGGILLSIKTGSGATGFTLMAKGGVSLVIAFELKVIARQDVSDLIMFLAGAMIVFFSVIYPLIFRFFKEENGG